MKTLNTYLDAQASATSQAPFLLVDIANWPSPSTVRYTNASEAVIHDGNTYQARPLAVTGIEQAVVGTPSALTLAVANHDLAISDRADQYQPKGATVAVYRGFYTSQTVTVTGSVAAGDEIHETGGTYNNVASGTLYGYSLDAAGSGSQTLRILLDARQTLASAMIVRTFRIEEQTAEFTCAGLASLLRDKPLRKLSRGCQWVFKGTECTYTGTDTACDYSPTDCAGRTGGSNFVNYGGFLFVKGAEPYRPKRIDPQVGLLAARLWWRRR